MGNGENRLKNAGKKLVKTAAGLVTESIEKAKTMKAEEKQFIEQSCSPHMTLIARSEEIKTGLMSYDFRTALIVYDENENEKYRAVGNRYGKYCKITVYDGHKQKIAVIRETRASLENIVSKVFDYAEYVSFHVSINGHGVGYITANNGVRNPARLTVDWKKWDIHFDGYTGKKRIVDQDGKLIGLLTNKRINLDGKCSIYFSEPENELLMVIIAITTKAYESTVIRKTSNMTNEY